MNIGTAHGSFASRSILGDIFSYLGVFQQPVNTDYQKLRRFAMQLLASGYLRR